MNRYVGQKIKYKKFKHKIHMKSGTLGKKTKSINNEYKRRDPSQKPRKYFQKVQNEISLTQRR